ncbi:AraC family transcriptional regulator [Paenibacillus protaetiae]|uniref:AraC family transcriptional regulator n=1 Tax=Paenibacillus protaetiae TaxID=2509456 RepID=A0A4P6EVL2_9BACL|nr:AraC family transcriptional regulator [Paenibacillus protaetiae]QAY66585.1 AraC family transcriptional regulator [Paenibacillus protaetiae]
MDTIAFPALAEADRRLPLYLTICGHWNNQEAIIREQGFTDYQWLQCVSGTGELFIGDARHIVKAGQGFLLLPEVPHRYWPMEEPWDVHFISFNGMIAETLLRQAGMMESGVYTTENSETIVSHMRNMYAMSQSDRSYLAIECSKLVYMFLLDLMKAAEAGAQSELTYSRLQPVFAYIEANMDKPVAIKELAACIGVTPQYLCLLFKKSVNMRPMVYVNRERINRSKELMFYESRIPLHEIARRVGFDSASYFSSVFKKQEGITPEQFKKLHGMR